MHRDVCERKNKTTPPPTPNQFKSKRQIGRLFDWNPKGSVCSCNGLQTSLSINLPLSFQIPEFVICPISSNLATGIGRPPSPSPLQFGNHCWPCLKWVCCDWNINSGATLSWQNTFFLTDSEPVGPINSFNLFQLQLPSISDAVKQKYAFRLKLVSLI